MDAFQKFFNPRVCPADKILPDKNEFFSYVQSKLPAFPDDHKQFLTGFVETLYLRGWDKDDVAAYLNCTEELNPNLDEDTALDRMGEVSKKYPPYKHAVFVD